MKFPVVILFYYPPDSLKHCRDTRHRNREAQSISASEKFLRLPLRVRAVEFPAELIIIKYTRESRYNETHKLVFYPIHISDNH